MNNKTNIIVTLLFAASCAFVSCDDWTDVESISIKQPGIEEQNPELYTKYLENLRQYKADTEHKKVYAWFDNSEKNPASRAQHITSLPDSIDIVGLMCPSELATFEKEEIVTLRQKGTKVVYAISYDEIKAQYENLISTQLELENESTFDTFLKKEIEKQLAYSEPFDGIILKLIGQNPKYMTAEDKATYTASQNIFFNAALDWINKNEGKFLSFQGKPQNVVDKIILSKFLHLIIDMYQVTDKNKFPLAIQDCLETGVPTDRFIMAVSTPSLDASDTSTGFIGKEKAIIETAYWITTDAQEYDKCGIAIDNIQNDYYQTNGNYHNVKETINIMNPAPSK